MKKLNAVFAMALLGAAASSAVAQTVDYKILINGVEAAVHNLAAGEYELRVEARVTNNDLTGGGAHGGFLQSTFDLTDTANAVIWEDLDSGFLGPGPDGFWDSTANSDWDTAGRANSGAIVDNGTDVIGENDAIAPINYNPMFNSIGANEFSLISYGRFAWNGTDTTIDLTVANLQLDVLVATLSGGTVVAVAPDTINFTSTMLTSIPEPATSVLAGLGLGLIVFARRRAAIRGAKGSGPALDCSR